MPNDLVSVAPLCTLSVTKKVGAAFKTCGILALNANMANGNAVSVFGIHALNVDILDVSAVQINGLLAGNGVVASGGYAGTFDAVQSFNVLLADPRLVNGNGALFFNAIAMSPSAGNYAGTSGWNAVPASPNVSKMLNDVA